LGEYPHWCQSRQGRIHISGPGQGWIHGRTIRPSEQVEQIFYIKDPANKKLHVVRDGKRRIVGVDNVIDEEEYNQNLHVRRQIDLDDDPEDEVAYVHSDHSEGISL
jgi:hypothetical protein